MEYRRLGPAGLKVSVLGFGSWVTFGNQLDQGLARACMTAAFEAGVNFFDNAESYASGESERLMGAAFKQLGWAREDYVVSTKFFWGIRDSVNTRNTLNRKYLLSAIDPSLERLGLDFVDLVYCHRPDPETPVEETVWAMHDIVASGRALYWGTSEWPADRIEAAIAVADRHHLHRPVVEQPQYNLLVRERVEQDYSALYAGPGLGLTVWSPLASGVLTGKYLQGIPAGSRIALPGYEWLRHAAEDPDSRPKVEAVVRLARELGCTPAQLALAWCARNPHVSSVITGASSVEQVKENLGALDVLERLDDSLAARLDSIAS
jgi:voltage-dependent potassium channel beta subunit